MQKLRFIAAFLLLSLFSCKDEPEQIPAYLHIEPFVVTEPGGANWQNLNLAWLYVGVEFLGAYTLPCTVPILASGEQEITIFPGINQNGLVETPEIYPFLTKYETKVVFSEAQTSSVIPTVKYDAVAKSAWGAESRLDGATIVFSNRDADQSLNLVFDETDAFSGRSARMAVDTAHPLMVVSTESVLGLPINGDTPCWVEMHYKCDTPFELWLLGEGGEIEPESSQAIYLFNATSKWKKIYINLGEFTSSSRQKEYRLDFRLGLPQVNNVPVANKATVQFDNLNILYY